MPEPVRPGVARVPQQVLQGRPVRPPPLQLPLGRAAGDTHGDADLVVNQVPEQSVQRGLAVELVEDQPDHGLDLLVGIDRPFAAGEADVAERRRAE